MRHPTLFAVLFRAPCVRRLDHRTASIARMAIGVAGVLTVLLTMPVTAEAGAKSSEKMFAEHLEDPQSCVPSHALSKGSGSGLAGKKRNGQGIGASDCDTRVHLTGSELFRRSFPGTNGRTCATCHVPEDNFTLTPAHVERLWAERPHDPLFNAIDADDPTAETLTYNHLRKGLIRVWLKLPKNMDVIDKEGIVITPSDRQIFVWRSVPSIADVALTAPYQLDGREATLEQQAQGAITSHSEGGPVSGQERRLIAAFERGIFSSDRARAVALGIGGDVEDSLILSPQEQRGRAVYQQVCESCHGGDNKATIVDREIHDLAFPALKPDGNVLYNVPATSPPTPILAAQPRNEFINIGSAVENFLVQIGATEHQSFTEGLSYPQYRFRFYKNAARKKVIAELPPSLPTPVDDAEHCGGGGDGDGGDGGDGNGGDGDGGAFIPVLDADCNPITGPNFVAQLFTTDPGRAAITGNPYDFEAFDIPTLRGISKTAPYWHNNISASLEDVVELYSDHLLIKFPPLILEGEKEDDGDGDIGVTVEALTRQQKDDLLAFLKRL